MLQPGLKVHLPETRRQVLRHYVDFVLDFDFDFDFCLDLFAPFGGKIYKLGQFRQFYNRNAEVYEYF